MNNRNHLFFDMDGTLLNSNHHILEENAFMIEKAKNSNYGISIISGRSINMCIKYINQLKLVDPIILANGNFIYYPQERKIEVLGKDLHKNVKTYIIEYLKINGGTICWFSEKNDYVYSTVGESSYINVYSTNVIDLSNYSLTQLEEHLLNTNVYHMSMVYIGKGINPNLPLNEITKQFKILEKLNFCKITENSNMFIDCDSLNINKYLALKYLIKKQDINPDNVYVFGDSFNDLEMISKVNNSVAMGNGEQIIKERAKYVIGDNNLPSIAQFIEKQFKLI